MSELFAKRYAGKINTGLSEPFLLECSDNNIYVIKYIGNRASNKVLINDLICSRLAKLVGISVPDAKIIYVPEVLIEMESELMSHGILQGNHFGSLYYKDTTTFTGSNALQYVENKDQIAKIIAFDYWVQNDDRSDNMGNLLIGTSKNNKNIISIDYGNAFNGPDWINEDLMDSEISIIPVDGRVYSCLFKEIKTNECFDDICSKIESLTIEDIEVCTKNIPDEWGLTQTQNELICSYLFNRKYKIRDTMDYIVKEKLSLLRR